MIARTWETLTLRDVFSQFYQPARLSLAAPRTLEQYADTLDYWHTYTGDPPLPEIDNGTLQQFVAGLVTVPNRAGGTLSANTIRKHLRHVQPILDFCGPRGPKRRDALGWLDDVPWVKPPRGDDRIPDPFTEAQIAAIYAAAPQARLPQLDGLATAADCLPGRPLASTADWWRGLVVFLYLLGPRIGVALALEWRHIDFSARIVHLPSGSQKQRADQRLPLPDDVAEHLRPLAALPRVFYWPHPRKRLWLAWQAIQAAAGLPESERKGFHALRKASCTEMASVNFAAAVIQMGHRRAETTRRSYLGPRLVAEAQNKMARPWRI